MSKRYSLPIPFGWYAVSFSDDLKAGDVKPIKYFGKNMVLFRSESGVAKVLDAYCPHLGAHLGHGGKVQGENIACPFHGWQFNGTGQCATVPYAKNMPPKLANGQQAIYAYPVVERNQMIWAWYHPERAAPSYEIDELSEYASSDWTPIERFEWTINVTLQETGENPVDAAHFIYVHNATDLPSGETKFEGVRRTANFTVKVPKLLDDGAFDTTGAVADVFLHTTSVGPSLGHQRFTGQVQATLMGLATPIDDQSMKLVFAFTRPKNLNAGQQMLADYAVKEICRQVEADIPIWENKIYLETPTLCDSDGPIHQYRKWFSQFYVTNKDPGNLRAVS